MGLLYFRNRGDHAQTCFAGVERCFPRDVKHKHHGRVYGVPGILEKECILTGYTAERDALRLERLHILSPLPSGAAYIRQGGASLTFSYN